MVRKKESNRVKPKANLNRKQLRKEKRKEKKVKRFEYHQQKTHSNKLEVHQEKPDIKDKGAKGVDKKIDSASVNKYKLESSIEKLRQNEEKQKKKIEKQMKKQRIEQLKLANLKEDETIKKLEKKLGLNKRKTKSLPKSFAADGLASLLALCDPESVENEITAEKHLYELNDEFDEDLALMTDQNVLTKDKKNEHEDDDNDDFSDYDQENDIDDDQSELFDSETENVEDERRSYDRTHDSESEFSEDESITLKTKGQKRKLKSKPVVNKKVKIDQSVESEEASSDENHTEGDSEADDVKDDEDVPENKSLSKRNADGTWEDIYGRLRNKDGSIVITSEGKYIPPAIRPKLESNNTEDKKRIEKLNRLKKQLKGFLNRLAESNMHNISTQIEDLYMKNSRNDMNESLTNLILESLVSNVLSTERLLIEHVVLIAVLHANVGTEVGAHFLQTVVRKFNDFFHLEDDVENKMLDNIVNILAQLYNFRLFDAKLLYEILSKLCYGFREKDIECILHILRNVGFSLRKDDPLALKGLILDLQMKSATVSDEMRGNSRIKFMLDILLAIKNNNVTKIPNYDVSYSEHMKKIMKSFIRKGNYVTQLNISLEDLLKADERGKWWVVGSAWSGNTATEDRVDKEKSDTFSSKLLVLAKKQRMNTDTRRNVFCIIMSAEDYLDAFEKLLKLGLKNQQEREIINVLLHCCLQEKVYNPYYGVLAQKFCDHDRKYQMIIKCSVWDKLKALSEHSGMQISNLAKMLIHLFIEKGLPISTLKIVEFSDLDKVTLRFMRQIILGIMLHNDTEACLGVFEKVAQSQKLKMFRESLRLFIHHFVLKNLKSDTIAENQREMLKNRAKLVELVLISKESNLKL